MTGARDSLLLTAARSLHLGKDCRYLLQTIPADSWPDFLRLTDESRLTLAIAAHCGQYLPDPVRERTSRDLQNNALRQRRMIADYEEIASTLNRRGIEFIVLKGLAQYSPYQQKFDTRPQYDLDLYCPPASAHAAADAIFEIGYEPVHSTKGPETDHLPPLVRKSQIKVLTDYYDPELPFSVEIHHRFWNPAREFISVGSSEPFWSRRGYIGAIPALDPADAISYAAWHLLKHLVRGNLRIFHVYELARFLAASAADTAFWERWDGLTNSAGRVVEAVAFRLAVSWFGCPVHPIVDAVIGGLPAVACRWFDLFALSPLLAAEFPNKDEMFLHLGLAQRWTDRMKILRQRIAPLNPPRVGSGSVQRQFLYSRASHHLSALGPVMRSASRWCFASGAAARD